MKRQFREQQLGRSLFATLNKGLRVRGTPTLTCSQANALAVEILGRADGVADEWTTIRNQLLSQRYFHGRRRKRAAVRLLGRLGTEDFDLKGWSTATASRPRRTTTTTPSSRFSRTAQEEEEEEEVAALLPEDKPHKPQSTSRLRSIAGGDC